MKLITYNALNTRTINTKPPIPQAEINNTKIIYEAVSRLLHSAVYDRRTGEVRGKVKGKTAIVLLAEIIGLGGGFSLRPRIKDYWFLNYKTGIHIEMDYTDPDGEVKTDYIRRAQIIKAAERYVSEHITKTVQLELFEAITY